MDNCPKCNSSWIGGEIPENIRHHYSGTHWKREIGIDGGYMEIYDGTVALKCPDCKEYVPVSNKPWAIEMYERFMGSIK
jgi:hypothetical protein